MNEKKMNITEGKVSKDLGEATSFSFHEKRTTYNQKSYNSAQLHS